MHTVRTASGHPVSRVAFSPCGSWFAVAQPHHGVTLYDRAGGAVVRTVGSPRRPYYSGLTFFRGGAWIAAAGWGLEVFDIVTGVLVATSTAEWTHGLDLTGHGDTLLAAGREPVIEIGTSVPGALYHRPCWYGSDEHALAVGPNGRWVVALRLTAPPITVDMGVGWPAHALKSQTRYVPRYQPGPKPRAAFAGAADRVALAGGEAVAVFDLIHRDSYPTGDEAIPRPLPVSQPVFALPPPDGWPAATPWLPPFALTPDGRGLLVKRPRERVQLWDVDAGTLAAEWSWRLDGITCLAVAPDGLTAVAGARHGRLVTWDLD